MPRLRHSYKILESVNTAAHSVGQYVGDMRHKEVVLSSDDFGAGDSAVFRVKGSYVDPQDESETVDFTAARSEDNKWFYCDLVSGSGYGAVVPSTGVTISDSDDVQQFTINIDGLMQVCVELVSISDNTTTVSADLHLFDDR